jgi:ABC-type antimicrobial peptide transport system permease subunit
MLSIKLAIQSIKFYKNQVVNQVLIIILLTAVITGSLLTGSSVKESLIRTASQRLGNADIVISSGNRYFSPDLGIRMHANSGISSTGLLETKGYCQVLNSQKGSFNTNIYGITKDFFGFQGFDTINLRPGEIIINSKLAGILGAKEGDDIMIRYKEISYIPSDAPFAPSKDESKSLVMKIGRILPPDQIGSFSLSISQITPSNIFVNLSDLEDNPDNSLKINRLLIKQISSNSLKKVSQELKSSLRLSDIGLKLRKVAKTGEYELISDRIFIDRSIINEIDKILPNSSPVITYLGNKFVAGSEFTPYSFVSALPAALYPEIPGDNGMIINRWMAEDLSVGEGDTIQMYWYSPDSLKKLVERNSRFIVKKVVDMKGIWSDSLLMPEFPGISGKESCSGWDAGVMIKTDEIRNKDEQYWKRYKGTPKAFIAYEKGTELWGNNFGPATALRYPAGMTAMQITDKLEGSLDPADMGFIIADLADESVKAANTGVDFGSLFLSLGFFLIVASLVLLSFAASSYFYSKRDHINTLFALGFKNRQILRMLFMESGLIALTGCFAGAFSGYLVTLAIACALNSVWKGAVQTDTIGAFFNLLPIGYGFLLTFLTIMTLMFVKIKRYLNRLTISRMEKYTIPSATHNAILVSVSAIITVSLFIMASKFSSQRMLFSFSAGAMLLVTLMLLWRQYYVSRTVSARISIKNRKQLSHLFYSFNPSVAVTPILFISAGIFTVFITGANRMNFSEKQMNRPGGTGGYLLWCESSIPVMADPNTVSGRETLGFDRDQLSGMSFILLKRSAGNDASCLNLNHIMSPPLLGVDPEVFIKNKSFSFAGSVAGKKLGNPWEYLNLPPVHNTIYGIADQTVLEWGLKIKTGDTLVMRAENGQLLNIIIAAGLQSSVFQGNVLIGMRNFTLFYPSVPGSQVMLVDGDRSLIDIYKNSIAERLENYGMDIEKTSDRLASFYQVTNTYLSVFGIFGALGMVIGIAGLGFVLIRNYNQRKHEFALLLATGFHIKQIRQMILSDQVLILFAGVSTGIISALAATSVSIQNSPGILWLFLIIMILAILATGIVALLLSVRSVTRTSLISSLKNE